ncbi:hypothetical protein PCS_02550 [Desulfocurvibacter africanus PCS]|uniref:Uncharacterized protein n=1 Tax=Desulfocurvibacter africanus PCS TaxID=1262666 RepID=M5Q1G8_DESAF|nr:hypothetical protein [Desulfocurvibacter africanus]EMG36538.1 hypothetical protein PCS_02550 [Desulfocurvibacter africanus PCS]
MQKKKEFDFFDKPQNRRLLWILLWVTCGLTVILELVAHPEHHFGFADIFGFNALLGFVACAILIVVAKLLGFFLKKPEDYYDE